MTQTTHADPPVATAPGSVLAVLPTDILTSLVVTLLVPMFLAASGGDTGLARMAALQTVNSYRTRTLADLIAAAQIVAYGLAALGSLSLSMEDGLSLPMILRLRGNANACTRSAEHGRRALEKSQSEERSFPRTEPTPADARYQTEVMTNLAETKKRTAETLACLYPAEPIAHPESSPATKSSPAASSALTLEDRRRQAAWADAMADVAAEFTAEVADLPPAERQEAAHRAELLTNCANQLLSGTVPPRPSPGDLDALIYPGLVRTRQEPRRP